MPRATDCMYKYGYGQSQLHHVMINQFSLPDYNEALEEYFILFWEPAYFLTNTFNGVIERCGKEYIVVYHECHRHELRNQKQLSLSFRRAKKEFNLPAYVLVSKGK